jgi:hypothetical protein
MVACDGEVSSSSCVKEGNYPIIRSKRRCYKSDCEVENGFVSGLGILLHGVSKTFGKCSFL